MGFGLWVMGFGFWVYKKELAVKGELFFCRVFIN
jgi:hypothetical protein